MLTNLLQKVKDLVLSNKKLVLVGCAALACALVFLKSC